VLSWSNDCTLRVWDAGTGAGRALTGHEDWVTGALLLPDGRVLSRSHDRSVRVHDIDGRDPALAFHFDATPTVVLPIAAGELFVGDALGRIHVLEIQDASYTRTVALRSSA
jgi:WD40 repeat protein